MKIIKQFRIGEDGRCYMLIRTNTYTSGLQHFCYLATLAIADFPGLTFDQIKIEQYGGRCFSGTYGIEWESSYQPSDGYTEIDNLPLTR